MSKTLAQRLLDNEHHGCTSWEQAAERFGVNERSLRAVRKILRDTGREVGLDGATTKSVEVSSRLVVGGDPFAASPRWPLLSEFDASTFGNDAAVRAAQQPYELAEVPSVKKLTHADCPDGTLILWASDIHIPIHNEAACRLMVEWAERAGVTRVVAGGDILDMNCLSKHGKASKRTVEHATILEEVEPGRRVWLRDWMASKETDFILGNHEDRLKRFVDENPAFHGSLVSNFAKVCELPTGINVLPQGGEVRLGNLVMSHGDAEFKNSSGGAHPATKLLSMAPDQSSIIGHLHRMAQARRTSRDEDGISRTRCAWTMGHMSIEEMHYGSVNKNPNWQGGFGAIRGC